MDRKLIILLILLLFILPVFICQGYGEGISDDFSLEKKDYKMDKKDYQSQLIVILILVVLAFALG